MRDWHPHGVSESELPRHLHRVYFVGDNSMSSQMQYPDVIPPELEPSVRKEKYEVRHPICTIARCAYHFLVAVSSRRVCVSDVTILLELQAAVLNLPSAPFSHSRSCAVVVEQDFAAECTSALRWKKWELIVGRLLQFVYFPVLPLWEASVRRRHIDTLLAVVDQNDNAFLRNTRAQVMGNCVLPGFSSCMALVWIDFLVPSLVRGGSGSSSISCSEGRVVDLVLVACARGVRVQILLECGCMRLRRLCSLVIVLRLFVSCLSWIGDTIEWW